MEGISPKNVSEKEEGPYTRGVKGKTNQFGSTRVYSVDVSSQETRECDSTQGTGKKYQHPE